MGRPLTLSLTDAAEADLANIWADIASKTSEAVASRFIAAIEATFQPVCHFPLAFPAREDLAPGLRVTFHSPYAVYYRVLENVVVIVRVLHGARDIAMISEQGGLD